MNRNPGSHILGTALVLPLVVLLLVGGSALVLAQPRGPAGGGMDHGPMLERIMERLDLSPAQEEELHELLAENREEHQAQWDAIKTARRALFDQIHAADFNEGAIRQAAAAVADIEEELAVSRALVFQQVQLVLTPEQKVELQEMIEAMQDFHEEWGGPHRRYHGRS